MLHYHNKYMRGTRLDVVVGALVLLFAMFLVAMIIGPVRTLAKERDVVRTSHVRELMTKVLQLELVDPEAYERLIVDVRAQGDLRSAIGFGACNGSHGPECSEAITADECLSLSDYFPALLLSTVPVDPRNSPYSSAMTGYYLATVDGQLEVGSCGAAGEAIILRTN